MSTEQIDRIRRRFRYFADVECGDYCVLYSQLSNYVAADHDLVNFIARMPEDQPNLFFAAVQYLTGATEMPANGLELKALVKSREDEVAALMRSHRTQTNEIGRCAAILPALPEGPLSLIEVGASAGLCLMLDKFQYVYNAIRVGDETSRVIVRCAVTGALKLRHRIPQIMWRHGLDLQPVDLDDDKKVRWLLACVWSDHTERRQRLEAAIDLCKTAQPPVRRGDLVDDLPSLVETAPENSILVIFHSAVLPYIAPARRQEFVHVLEKLSKRRDIVWISNEVPGIIPEMTELAPQRNRLRFLLGRTVFCGGRRTDELLALSHYHGWDLEWLAL